MDKLEFLDEQPEKVEEVSAPVEPETEPKGDERQEETTPDRARGPDGKFVGKDEPKPEPVMVPLAALQEVRDEVKQLKAERQQGQVQQPSAPPDIFEDPEGRLAAERQNFQQALYTERYNNSLRFATIQHGEESVKDAVNWAAERAEKDPQFNMAALSQTDPVGFAVEQYRREQMASVDPSEYQQFTAWKATQAQAPQESPTPTPPPQSIASMPSSGGAQHIPVGPGQAFDTLFK